MNDLVCQIRDVPAWSWWLQLAGLITSYIGAELNARTRVSGFVIWLFSNVALGAVHVLSGLWLLLVLDLLYLRVNLSGIARWARTRPNEVPAWMRRLGQRRPAP